MKFKTVFLTHKKPNKIIVKLCCTSRYLYSPHYINKVKRRPAAAIRKQRITRFFCHIIRRDGSSLEKKMIEGNIEGKGSRRRTPIRCIYQIKSITGYPLEDTIKLRENRKRWQEIINNIN